MGPPAGTARPTSARSTSTRGAGSGCAPPLDAVGIGVELGVWTTGDAVQLKQAGVPRGTVRVLAEVTVTDPDTAVAEAVRILNALGPMPAPILLHGEEAGAWPVLEYAQRINLDTRIGFEDTLEGPDGTWLATGNEELVRYALGKDVAGPLRAPPQRHRAPAGCAPAPLWPGSRAEHRR